MAALTDYTLRPRRPPVNARSLLLGLAGVVGIAALVPYNDYALDNTLLIGAYVPIGLLAFMLVLILLVNAPLSRWAPGHALDAGELAVVLGMILVGCAVPSAGLMCYLPASLVGLHHHAAANASYRAVLEAANLPAWVFPKFSASTLAEQCQEDVVRHFWLRTPQDDSGGGAWSAIPWALWRNPAVGWALLLTPLFGSYLFLSILVRRQWAENERLPFPIATVYLQLIELPKPGRWFNTLLSSRAFWIAAVGVVLVHSTNALSQYWPRYVPSVPLGYNFTQLFGVGLWRATHWSFKANTVSFAIVAITYFLQSKVAFSLWAFYLLWQAVAMLYGSYGSEFPEAATIDQMFGAAVVIAALTVWVGRHHWAMVLRHMLFRAGRHDAQDPYVPYALAGWGFLACLAGVFVWLRVVGATSAGALVLVAMLMLVMLTISRVVAETGLVFAKVQVPLFQPWVYLADLSPGLRTTAPSFFLTSWFHQIFSHDTRESLPVYALHAFRVADTAAYGAPAGRRRAWPFLLALVLAVAVAYVVAGASTLLVEYNYAEPLGINGTPPLNPWGVDGSTRMWTLDPAVQYTVKNAPAAGTHSRVGHFGFGVAFTSFLAVMRLHFTWWPLHPLGFLLGYTVPLQRTWLSLFIGWLAKVLIVRFGGATFFRKAQPFFIGLLVGEAAATGIWIAISLVLAWLGLPFHRVHFNSN